MSLFRFITLILIALVASCSSTAKVTSPTGQAPIEVLELSVEEEVSIDAANIAKEHGDYDEALKLFKEVLETNPVATDAYVGMGDIYLAKQDWSQAEPAFARAAKLEPRDFDAQFGHGVSLQMLKRFVDAVRAYHKALTINPDDLGANINISTTYLQMGRPQSALVFAQRAAELGGDSAGAQMTLAATYQLLGKTDMALDAYIAASELMEEPSPQLMRNIIYLLVQQKRYQEVVNTTEQLVLIDPTTDSYERLGWAEFRLGDYESSLEAYRMSVDYDDMNWRSLNGIGVNELNKWLLSDRTDMSAYQSSRTAFRRSLGIYPDQPKVITLVLRYGL